MSRLEDVGSAEGPCDRSCPLYDCPTDPTSKIEVPNVAPRTLLDQSKQAERLFTPLADWQLRIFALSPGLPHDPLKGALQIAAHVADGGVVLLESKQRVNYEALSYCWGEPCFEAEVECNDTRYPITRNLYAALRHLRQQLETQFLWIDALCINQYDLEERGGQVAKMFSIFQKAQQVLVWLGEHGASTKFACTYANSLNWENRYGTLRDDDLESIQNPLRRHLCADTGFTWCSSHAQCFVSGLHDLLTRAWYDRLWVIQEVWAAQDITFICGQYRAEWSSFKAITEDASRALRSFNHQFDDPFTKFTQGSAIGWSLRLKSSVLYDKPRWYDLLLAIQRASSSVCTDPRDHVYGVLGMVERDALFSKERLDEQACLRIDYSQPVCQVYTKVVEFFLMRDYSFVLLEQMLCAKPQRHGERLMGGQVDGENLPSWCPNWSVPFNLTPSKSPWQTGGSWLSRMRNSSILRLHGLRFGTVTEVERVEQTRCRHLTPYYDELYQLSVSMDLSDIGSIRHFSELWDDILRNSPDGRPLLSLVTAKINDFVAVIDAFRSPVILRQHGDSSYYSLVGTVVFSESISMSKHLVKFVSTRWVDESFDII